MTRFMGASAPLWNRALLLWCTIYSFDFTPQSHPFAVCHIWLTGAFVLWNLWGYRKQVQQIERYRGALA